jgi:hypothetical protein
METAKIFWRWAHVHGTESTTCNVPGSLSVSARRPHLSGSAYLIRPDRQINFGASLLHPLPVRCRAREASALSEPTSPSAISTRARRTGQTHADVRPGRGQSTKRCSYAGNETGRKIFSFAGDLVGFCRRDAGARCTPHSLCGEWRR